MRSTSTATRGTAGPFCGRADERSSVATAYAPADVPAVPSSGAPSSGLGDRASSEVTSAGADLGQRLGHDPFEVLDLERLVDPARVVLLGELAAPVRAVGPRRTPTIAAVRSRAAAARPVRRRRGRAARCPAAAGPAASAPTPAARPPRSRPSARRGRSDRPSPPAVRGRLGRRRRSARPPRSHSVRGPAPVNRTRPFGTPDRRRHRCDRPASIRWRVPDHRRHHAGTDDRRMLRTRHRVRPRARTRQSSWPAVSRSSPTPSACACSASWRPLPAARSARVTSPSRSVAASRRSATTFRS